MIQHVPAIFLDRDGTLNVDHGYVYDIDHFQFIDGVIEACRNLKEMGFALILVTNQSGIARGKFSKKQFIHLTAWMNKLLVSSNVNFDGIYFCPHHPKALITEYRQECYCRKPKPGMLLKALYQLNIDKMTSYMVGDKLEDMQVAIAAGIGTKVLVRTGKVLTEKGRQQADVILNSLADLPEVIRKRM
ncbi:D-glycero-beta-D-manno-heptose 1,7-bisphosphate 7-phosphatase [Candidatus Gillettellia adelgis]